MMAAAAYYQTNKTVGQCVHKWLFLAILAIFNASGHVAMAWPFTRIRKFFLKYIK
jgi:hypothetical protein